MSYCSKAFLRVDAESVLQYSKMSTTHYDFSNGPGATKLVLDTWKAQATLIDNDVMPASRECPIVSGIENIANTLSKSGPKFTTIPLGPLTKYVNFLPQNYININVELDYQVTVNTGTNDEETNKSLLASGAVGKLAVYLPSTAMMIHHMSLLVGNSTIWTNSYQRQEATVTMASLPAGLINKSADYTTLSKLIRGDPFPGFIIDFASHVDDEANSPWAGFDTVSPVLHGKVNLSLNIDLSHISPIISNLHFTTPDMGELRLRLFFDDFEDAWSYTHIPNTSIIPGPRKYLVSGNDKEDIGSAITNTVMFGMHHGAGGNLLSRYPIGSPLTISTELYLEGGNGKDIDEAEPSRKADVFKITPVFNNWKFHGKGVEIVQSCFDIRDESKLEIKKYIAQDNKLIIPTQSWTTTVSTNNFSTNAFNDLVFQICAYNVSTLAFLFPRYNDKSTIYPHVFPSNIDIKYNSKNINYIPYDWSDVRLHKDTVQALINDDYYAPNENLVCSISPAYLNGWWNGTDNSRAAGIDNSLNKLMCDGKFFKCPNTYTMAFGLSPVNSFEKGFSPASSNQGSAQIRFKAKFGNTNTIMDPYNNTVSDVFDNVTHADETLAYCLCLCDCCLVLEYNPVVGTCQAGSVVYAEPFVI